MATPYPPPPPKSHLEHLVWTIEETRRLDPCGGRPECVKVPPWVWDALAEEIKARFPEGPVTRDLVQRDEMIVMGVPILRKAKA